MYGEMWSGLIGNPNHRGETPSYRQHRKNCYSVLKRKSIKAKILYLTVNNNNDNNNNNNTNNNKTNNNNSNYNNNNNNTNNNNNNNNLKVQTIFHGRNNIINSTNCKYRIAVTVHTVET
jgi:hypothetical protein